MGGIAGVVSRTNNVDLSGNIKAMTGRVRHRGPDAESFCMRGRVALGQRSLGLVDVSALRNEPMTYGDDRYAITSDGEIYNHSELRSELEALGFRFRGRADAEVVVAAYAAWGSACLSRFNGVWAFAIHDRDEDIIFAARDRFGVKPFYWVLTETCFAFGSEIRQLLPLLPAVRANQRVVSDFLLTGALVEAKETFFDGVMALLPGHSFSYNVGVNHFVIERYYNLLERINDGDRRPEHEAIRDFRLLFEDSVRLRLRSDLRVGSCLSGGLDSSSVALIAARMYHTVSKDRHTAITAISEDPGNSEETYAGEVARAGSLEWIKTRPTYDDFLGLLPTVVRHQEEPFGSPSVCMQAAVMLAARQNGISVLLDGQGADGLLGGSHFYPAFCITTWREEGPRKMLREVRQILRDDPSMSLWSFAAYCAFALIPSVRYLYYRRRSNYMARHPAMPEWIGQFALACRDLRQVQALELETTALPSLLHYLDRNSMTYSIPVRLPFLDYRLVETSIAMQPGLKMGKGWTKWALRQALSDVLPHNIAWRRDKIAFEAPTEKWLCRHIDIMTEKLRSSPLIRRFCDLDRLLLSYPRLAENQQWKLYSLALWEQEFGVRVEF